MRWVPWRVVKGIAYDTPIQGYGVNTCNTLRLWSAEAVESFDFQAFNVGDYYKAVDEKLISETVTKVLYPTTSRDRQAPASGTAVFLRVLFAAGHAAPARNRR
jgi:glucan phosphorylase